MGHYYTGDPPLAHRTLLIQLRSVKGGRQHSDGATAQQTVGCCWGLLKEWAAFLSRGVHFETDNSEKRGMCTTSCFQRPDQLQVTFGSCRLE